MLAWLGVVILLSFQISSLWDSESDLPIYQTKAESAKIASKDVLAEKITPTLTPTPTLKLNPTNIPTFTVSPTPIKTASNPINVPLTPTPTQAPTNTSSNWQTNIMGQINSFRSGKGLPSLSMNGETCSFAKTRVSEIDQSLSHSGFSNRISSNSLPYPGFTSVAENLAWHYDSTQVVPGWIASSSHNENLSKDVPFGCVERNGDLYVFEAWKP